MRHPWRTSTAGSAALALLLLVTVAIANAAPPNPSLPLGTPHRTELLAAYARSQAHRPTHKDRETEPDQARAAGASKAASGLEPDGASLHHGVQSLLAGDANLGVSREALQAKFPHSQRQACVELIVNDPRSVNPSAQLNDVMEHLTARLLPAQQAGAPR